MPLMIKQFASGTGSHEPVSGESTTVHRIYQEGCVTGVYRNSFLSGKLFKKSSSLSLLSVLCNLRLWMFLYSSLSFGTHKTSSSVKAENLKFCLYSPLLGRFYTACFHFTVWCPFESNFTDVNGSLWSA